MKKFLLIFLFFVCFLTSSVLATGTVEINTASLAQLDEITGVGPVLAQRIIDARPFSSVDDLDRVKGIGPAILQKIKDQGLAYVSDAPQAPVAAENITPVIITTPQETPTPEPIGTTNKPLEEASAKIYPSGVFLNEILPNPEGPDEQEEFVELYNSNNFDVDLSGWEIKDITGSITNHFFPLNTIIQAGKFLTIYRLKTKVTLNNDGDGLILSSPDKKIVDSVVFTSAPLGQSYSKNNSSWLWSTTLTPDAKNIITSLESLSNAKNSVKNSDVNASLAAISQNISQDALKNNLKAENPWFLFFTTLVVTIILATIVLFIKLRFMSVTKP